MSREQQVSRAFVTLADTLTDDFDPLALFQRLVEHCTGLLAVDAAGVMMKDARGSLRTMAASSEEAALLELLQLQNSSGPCVESFHQGRSVDVPDLSRERERWPQVIPAAVEAGFASMFTVPLRLHDYVLGAVNLFRLEEGSLPCEDQFLAQDLADATILALMHWSTEPVRSGDLLTRLQSVIAAKATLEIAKGMLAEYGGVSIGAAARILRSYVEQRGVRLVDTVEALTSSELHPAGVFRVETTHQTRPAARSIPLADNGLRHVEEVDGAGD